MKTEQSPFSQFIHTVEMLRTHCPWDKKQTLSSSQKYLTEEYLEVLEAMQGNDSDALREELGDLIFIVVLISQICSDSGQFTIEDVIETINMKMIRRHPHVFETKTEMSEEELRKQWKRIKNEEKNSKKIDTAPGKR
ncbi:MAG: MazG nucleotide pyrophosphohydrolase domain-containing protein [Thermodesulfobacteriota bacterium]